MTALLKKICGCELELPGLTATATKCARHGYAEIPAINWSTLKVIGKSPRHYQHALTTPRTDTPALSFGRIVHCAVFEPLEMPRRYVVAPECDKRTTKCKKAWAAFVAANAGREIVDRDDYDRALLVGEAVRAHPVAASYLAAGVAESVCQWTDADTGLRCKGRRDWVSTSRPAIVDLKTARDLSPRAFAAAVARYEYDAQLAFYGEGERVTTRQINPLPLVIIGVESVAPYDVGVFVLDDEATWRGMAIWRAYLKTLKQCRESGQWPGQYPAAVSLSLPMWAFPSDDGIEGMDLEFGEESTDG